MTHNYYRHSLVLKEEDVASSASARVRLLPLGDPNNVDLVVTPVGPTEQEHAL